MDKNIDVQQPKGGSPIWLALAAGVSFVLLTLLSILSIASHFLTSEDDHGDPGPGITQGVILNERQGAAVESQENPAIRNARWTDALFASECPAPCSAGPLCQRTTENEGAICGKEDVNCEGCASKMKCVPGRPEDDLAMDEGWLLHLSAIYFETKLGLNTRENPCSRSDDVHLCVRPSGTEDWQCLSQLEACRNENESVAAIPIAVRQLVESGIDLSVRAETEHGVEIARRSHAHFPTGLRRRGLCSGFRLDLEPTDTAFVWFTFFLEPAPH